MEGDRGSSQLLSHACADISGQTGGSDGAKNHLSCGRFALASGRSSRTTVVGHGMRGRPPRIGTANTLCGTPNCGQG
jgi:hypothetical protein